MVARRGRRTRLVSLALLAVLGLLTGADVRAQTTRSVTLEWDQNTESDLDGYLVLVGASLAETEQRIDVGPVTSWEITVPVEGARYAWVVAYNMMGRFSEPSAPVSLAMPSGDPPSDVDADGDGLPDGWARSHHVESPDDDPDGDGVTNVEESARGTDPRIPNSWVFAEGAGGAFTERLALVNPGTVPASGVVMFRLADGDRPVPFVVAARSRTTLDVNQELAGFPPQTFTTVVQTDRGGVVAERTMQWGLTGSGIAAGHTGTAIAAASREWYFPDVPTDGFETVLLLANALDETARVQIDYRGAGEGVVTRAYDLAPRTRLSIRVNDVAGLIPGAYWAILRSSTPIVAERASYLIANGQRGGGDLTAGIPAPSETWYFAEGVTGPSYDTSLVLVNPQSTLVIALITWLREGGSPIRQVKFLGPGSRTVISADASPWLSAAVVAPVIAASGGIVAERIVSWPGTPQPAGEFHTQTGAPALGTQWVFAEGEAGGALEYESYLLVANPGSASASVRVTGLGETGPSIPVVLSVAPGTRASLPLGALGLTGRFGIRVDSSTPVMAERSMYWQAPGEPTRGGTNSSGYRVR